MGERQGRAGRRSGPGRQRASWGLGGPRGRARKRGLLFLGAGASTGCRNLLSEEPPLSRRLMQVLADAMKLPLDKTETLRSVTTAARRRLGADFDEILRRNYTVTKAFGEYSVLPQYTWSRIYTLNIDDGLEGAFRSKPADHRIFYHKQPLFDIDRSTASTNIIKLNGSVDRLYDGIIFSEEEILRKRANQS